jgi:hypothetical protein
LERDSQCIQYVKEILCWRYAFICSYGAAQLKPDLRVGNTLGNVLEWTMNFSSQLVVIRFWLDIEIITVQQFWHTLEGLRNWNDARVSSTRIPSAVEVCLVVTPPPPPYLIIMFNRDHLIASSSLGGGSWWSLVSDKDNLAARVATVRYSDVTRAVVSIRSTFNPFLQPSLRGMVSHFMAVRSLPSEVDFNVQTAYRVTQKSLNHFRSYLGPRLTVWFSSSAPMSEDVRHGFCCVCSSAVGACPTLFFM